MKGVKKLFLILGVLIVLLIGTLIAIPYFFKDKILVAVKKAANENVNAIVDFKDVNLSLFRDFPNLYVGLEDLSVIGIGDFENVPLTTMESFDISLNLMSVIKQDQIKVNGIQLTKPLINIFVTKDGKANYDIAKATETSESDTNEPTTTETTNFKLDLESYAIHEGKIIYEDLAGDIYVNLQNVNHSGSGDFSSTVFNLDTETKVEQLTAKSVGIAYLNRAEVELDAIFGIDTENEKYTLKDNDLRINALQLLADGFVQMKGDDIYTELDFKAPQADLKAIMSLIPNAYIEDYSDVKASGDVGFAGNVKGTYNERSLPSFKLDMFVKNGDVKYPDLPLGISNINSTIKINSPGGADLDRMIVDIPNFKMNVENDPFEARLYLKTPISDPDVDAAVKGHLDLSKLAQAFPMEAVESLNGILDADVTMRAKMSDLEQERYEDVDMAGNMVLQNMLYQGANQPPVNIKNLAVDFSPKFVALNNFDGTVGKSDIVAKGRIDNILAYIKPNTTMKGTFSVKSNFIDANEMMKFAETPEEENVNQAPGNATAAPEEASETEEKVFDAFDMNMDIAVDRLEYETYTLTGNYAKGHFLPAKFTLEDFKTVINDKNDLKASGVVENVFPYLFENEELKGNIQVSSKYFNLNDFMTPTEGEATAQPTNTESTEDIEPFVIPENIKMTITAKMEEVIYDNLDLKNVRGALQVADQAVKLDGVKANTLGGEIGMTGGYDSKNPEKPGFDLDYAMSNINFKEAFEKFNTVKLLAPIAQFMDGTFSTNMKMNGFLGKDMMPDMNTLNIDGLLKTFNAVVKSFKPLQEIGNKLNVDYFNNMRIEDSKNYFTVQNGTVEVKPFDTKVKDIPLNIRGSHSLTNEMNYQIQTAIPVEKLGSDVSGFLNKGMEGLSKEASKLGIDVGKIKNLKLAINITGSAQKPKIQIKPLGGEGSSTKEIIKNVIDDTKEKVKEEVTKKIDEEKGKAKEKLNAEIAKIEAEYAKKKEALLKEGNTAAEKLRTEGYKQADELVTKAGNNLFKKKAAEIAANEMKKKTDKEVEKLKLSWQEKVNKLDAEAEKQKEATRQKYDDL